MSKTAQQAHEDRLKRRVILDEERRQAREAERRKRAVRRSGPPRKGEYLTCQQCGARFYVSMSEVRRGRQYCSRRCMGDAMVKMQTCKVCGKEFGPASPPRETCSAACRSEASRRSLQSRFGPAMVAKSVATRRARREQLDGLLPGRSQQICARPGCGKALSGQAAIYCSPTCHYEDRHRRQRSTQPVHRCRACGTLFRWNGCGKGIYCSLGCSRKAGRPHPSPDVVVERVDRERHRRIDFRDATFTCRACGAAAVHQHHVVFRQHLDRVGADRWHPDDALALCRACHGQAHALRLPLAVLRDANFAFAASALGAPRAYEYLRRRYAGRDARLDRLLDQEYAIEEPAR